MDELTRERLEKLECWLEFTDPIRHRVLCEGSPHGRSSADC
jgi:hypothetical protein